ISHPPPSAECPADMELSSPQQYGRSLVYKAPIPDPSNQFLQKTIRELLLGMPFSRGSSSLFSLHLPTAVPLLLNGCEFLQMDRHAIVSIKARSTGPDRGPPAQHEPLFVLASV